jgi:hypothetical protein
VLLAGASQIAAAASNTIVNCDRIAVELRSLDVDTEELTLDIVEHSNKDINGFNAPPRSGDAKIDAVAPVLLLTPRVATILAEVFGSALPTADVQDDVAADVQKELTEPADAAKIATATTSPIAASGDTTADPVSAAPPPLRNDSTGGAYLPRFQRLMYRTDI